MAHVDEGFGIASNYCQIVNGHKKGIACDQSLCVFFKKPERDDYTPVNEQPSARVLFPNNFETEKSKIDPYLLTESPTDIALQISPVSITGEDDQCEMVAHIPSGEFSLLHTIPYNENEQYCQGDKLYAFWNPTFKLDKPLVFTFNKCIQDDEIKPYLIGTILNKCKPNDKSPMRIHVL